MATKFRFTKKAIEDLAPPAQGRDQYADTEQAGLRLNVSPSGRRSFVFIGWSREQSKTLCITLGTYPALTVHQARDLARRATGQLAVGEDPRPHGRTASARATLEEVFARYIVEAARRKRTWRDDQRQFEVNMVPLHKRKLSAITRPTVRTWFNEVTDSRGPYQANRSLALLSSVFAYAVHELEVDLPNPCQGIRRNREQERDRFLTAGELSRFLAVLDEETTPETWRAFFKMLLFTGARKSNVASMRWTDIDLATATWRVPADEFKTGEAHRITLAAEAVEILRVRHEGPAGSGEFVFPSHGREGHITSPKEAWCKVLDRAQISDLRIHDLRRTLGSWQAAGGASLAVIGKSLGHRNTATTAIYARLDLDPVRASVDAAVSAMLATVKD